MAEFSFAIRIWRRVSAAAIGIYSINLVYTLYIVYLLDKFNIILFIVGVVADEKTKESDTSRLYVNQVGGRCKRKPKWR